MYKVIPECEQKAFKSHKDKWGDFNSFPPGWIDVSDQPDEVGKIMRRIIGGDFKGFEGRQMYNRKSDGSWGKMIAATLFFSYDDNNFALEKKYVQGGGWEIKYYLFGCQHKNSSCRKIGRCYYRYACDDCGVIWNVDSGD